MSGTQASHSSLYPLIPRRPAVAVVICLVAGIVLHPSLPIKPWAWLTMIASLVTVAYACRDRAMLASASTALALLLVGVALAQLHAFQFAADDIANYATDNPRLARLEMTVDYPPRVLTREFDARPIPPRQVFTGRVTRVLEWQGWTDASGHVLVQIDQPHPRLQAGQTIQVLGMLQRPSEAMNLGQFNWAGYYREQRILSSIRIRGADNIQVVSHGWTGPISLLRRWTRQALARGFDSRQSLDHALLCALLLGDSDPELRDVQEQFIRTGASHHLAISGMHIAILGGFVFCICRLLGISPSRTTLIVGCFVALYGLVALPSPPVLRSVALCLFMGIGVLSRRSIDMLQMLAMSAVTLLIIDPLDLYNAGFQLSFITVLGLVVLTGPVMQTLRREEPPWATVPAPHFTRRQFAWMRLKHHTLQILAAALVAWLVSLPLVAYHFERLNPWAMFASIALAPVVFVGLILGLMKVVLTLLLPSLAGAWAVATVWPITLMRVMVDWLATLPGSDLAFPRPTIGFIVFYYCVLALPLMTIPTRLNVWRLARLTPATCCLLFMCLPLLGAKTDPPQGKVRLTVLAIGAGSCAVLELPDRRTVVFDAGSLTLTDPVDRCIGPFLRHRGINRIDSLFLSHANYDHFAAALELIEEYDVQRVYLPPQFEMDSLGNPPAERLMRHLAREGPSPQIMQVGDQLTFDSTTHAQVLWPPPDASLRLNDASLVLRLNIGDQRILLPGDVQSLAQQRLLDTSTDLRADVLIAPHHGSFESTTGAFLRAVAPSTIIASNDRTLTLRQNDFAEVVSVPLFRTHVHGAVTIVIDDGRLTVRPFHPAPTLRP